MRYDLLKAQLTQAEELNNAGKYEEAEILANDVLAALNIPSPSLLREQLGETEDNRGARKEASLLEDEQVLRCKALITLSTAKRRRGDFQIALSLAHTSLDIAEESTIPELIAKALGNCGVVYGYLSDYANALTYSQKALAIYEEIGSKDGIASNLGNIGNVYVNLADYANALTYFQKTIDIYEEIGNKVRIAVSFNNIGQIYRHLSDFTKELEYYQKALAINEEFCIKDGMAGNFSNIGIVYWNLSDYDKAIEYYRKSLSINEELGKKYNIAINLGNIGNFYHKLSDHNKAMEYYLKALDVNEEIGQKKGIAMILGNIGELYRNMSDYSTALEYYQKALAINDELGTREGSAINLGRIGDTFATPDFSGYDAYIAEEYLKKSVVLSNEIGAKLQSCKGYKKLAKLYKQTEQWKEFSIHFEEYHNLNEEIQSEDAKKKAILLEHNRKIDEAERDRQVKIARFQEQEKILHNILPAQIAERMVAGEKMIAETYENVSVFFSDIVGFTKLSQQVSAEELVRLLNGIFTQFDQIARKHGLEKIKTIGDAYMAVAGAPTVHENNAERAAFFALEVVEIMKNYHTDMGEKIDIRIGLHSGSAVAGIIGENKFAYDLWGDAVNTAARMESHGEPGKIHVSEEFLKKLLMVNGEWLIDDADEFSSLTINHLPLTIIPRGEMDIKGKGMMKTYFLEKT